MILVNDTVERFEADLLYEHFFNLSKDTEATKNSRVLHAARGKHVVQTAFNTKVKEKISQGFYTCNSKFNFETEENYDYAMLTFFNEEYTGGEVKIKNKIIRPKQFQSLVISKESDIKFNNVKEGSQIIFITKYFNDATNS